MKTGVEYKELKDIEKRILKGIKIEDNLQNVKTVGAFDVGYSGKKYVCVAVVMDIESKKELETKSVTGDEVIPYSISMVAFREGPAILDAYHSLDIKPDVLIVKGSGAIHSNKVSLASYVGILTNKPCFGVSQDLLFGKLDEDKILFDNELKGIAIKTKAFSNPIYIIPGHNISIESSVKLTKDLISEEYKMPLPIHLAHKLVNKLKKEFNIKIIQNN